MKTSHIFLITTFFFGIFFEIDSLAETTKLSVLEFNTWGVPFAVKDTFRYSDAMLAIENMNPDIVFLEELFSPKGRAAFHSEVYPYEANGPRWNPLKLKIVPSGIRVLSKFPILSMRRVSFSKCLKDDCLSRKGALILVVQLPNGQKLNVVGTHLNARGEDDVREAQIDQIKDLILDYGDPEAPLLLGGDFNFNETSPAYPYVMKALDVKDTWTETHPISDPGITYDAEKNQYAHDYCVKTHFPLNRERIDFLMTKSSENTAIVPISSKIIFKDGELLSDHYGLIASYELTENAGHVNP